MAKTQAQAAPTGVSAADLDRAKARVAELRSKVDAATAEWEQAQQDLKTKAKQFLTEYGLTHLFESTPTKGKGKSQNGEAKGQRWRLAHILEWLSKSNSGLTREEIHSRMETEKPLAKTYRLAFWLKEYATEKDGRYVLNSKGKSSLKG